MQKSLPCNQELIRSSCAGVLRNDHERAREGHIWGTYSFGKRSWPRSPASSHHICPAQHRLRVVWPSVLAVFRLITSSNFVGCSTGRSAGLAPLGILSMYLAARRNKSG